MITEDYVSFETAKLLKEKGFDARCFHIYRDDGVQFYCATHRAQPITNEEIEDDNQKHPEYKMFECTCPTLQMATKWVQETFNIVIIPNYEYECNDTPRCYKIFKLGENGKPERVAVKGVSYDKDDNPTEYIVGYRDYERSYKDYATKEEAIEEGIKHCLENLV